jgi:general secretion pathway protein A
MYYQHFGLSGPPFQFTASPNVLYLSKSHRECLSALEWGLLHEPSGFSLLIGETGTGKTTLVCSILARQLENVFSVYINNPKLTFEEILRLIVRRLEISVLEPGKLGLLEALSDSLATLKSPQRVALIIDEAQDLSNDALEEIRLLSNFESQGRKALQIVLVGQPELLRRLMTPAMRQFNERISARAMLTPMSAKESLEYIDCRLRDKGGSADRIFDQTALRLVVEHGNGIPRRINALSHNAMLLGYSSGARKVKGAFARVAAVEYENLFQSSDGDDQRSPPSTLVWRWRPFGVPVIGLSALALLAICGVLWWSLQIEGRRERDNADAKSVSFAPVAAARPTPVQVAPQLATTAARAIVPVFTVVDDDRPTATTTEAVPPPPAPVSAAPPESEAAKLTPARQLVVRYGDTLLQIAMRYLGSERAVNDLINANPQLVDVNRIYPGQKLTLPNQQRAANTE